MALAKKRRAIKHAVIPLTIEALPKQFRRKLTKLEKGDIVKAWCVGSAKFYAWFVAQLSNGELYQFQRVRDDDPKFELVPDGPT